MLRRPIAAPMLMLLTIVTLLAATALLPTRAGAQRVTAAAEATTEPWPVNSRGQTYGTPTGTPYDYQEPDLIKVRATIGKTGYALRSDLEGQTPASPAEALAIQATQANADREIPVYESDGITQIGVFICE